MHALILVDLQNDFVAGGALAVPSGIEVIPVANELMTQFEFVLATQDWHPPNHGSFASQHDGVEVGDVFDLNGLQQIAWPDHCIQGTRGAEFAPDIDLAGIAHVVRKGTERETDSYSGFFDNGHRVETRLNGILQELGVREVSIMGLATDYCVKFTALDAVQLGYETNLILAGCRGVNLSPEDTDRAIDELRNAGVKIA